MTNNDVLRNAKQIFEYDDAGIVSVFKQADFSVTDERVSAWLKAEDEPGYEVCSDVLLATFLNGLINDQRGKKDGSQPEPEKTINNNIIFRKLKIALDFQAEDILEVLEIEGVDLSKHELSALFRKPTHKHFRPCSDEVLQAFIQGLLNR